MSIICSLGILILAWNCGVQPDQEGLEETMKQCKKRVEGKHIFLELQGIEPRTSHMLSERSTI